MKKSKRDFLTVAGFVDARTKLLLPERNAGTKTELIGNSIKDVSHAISEIVELESEVKNGRDVNLEVIR